MRSRFIRRVRDSDRRVRSDAADARARYNLAISSISLGAYAHAAEHLLQALELQHDDAAHLRDLTGEADPSASTADAGGLTSDALWSTLRMCCSLCVRDQPGAELIVAQIGPD